MLKRTHVCLAGFIADSAIAEPVISSVADCGASGYRLADIITKANARTVIINKTCRKLSPRVYPK
jgi:hypothetical protein